MTEELKQIREHGDIIFRNWCDETIELAIELHNKYESISVDECYMPTITIRDFIDLSFKEQIIMLKFSRYILSKYKLREGE